MKFGKYLEGRQLELPEYNGHFINYKALKKLIKQLSVPVASSSGTIHILDDIDESIIHQRLRQNKASFFFKVERELEKVNEYYLEKESNLRIRLDTLQSRYEEYKKRGKLTSKKSVSYKHLRDGIKKFQRDLAQLEQFVELNRTGFSKVLKKWDKRSHSHTKDFYLATVVSVQPVFTRNEVSKLNDTTLAILMELDEISNDESLIFYSETTTTQASSRHSGIDQTVTIPSTRVSTSQSTVSSAIDLFDTEMEIESWYLEALSIGRLKDEHPKFELLKTFVQHKVQDFVNDHIPQGRIDKNLIIRESLTKIFLLLVSSTIDDDSLHVFFQNGSENIDLSYSDEEELVFSRRNVFHEAAICESQSRVFVLGEAITQCQQSLLPQESLRKLLNARDIHGRTPLHYACELGKMELVQLLVQSQMLDSVDVLDNDSKTPLILAITRNHIDITKTLLVNAGANPSPEINEFSRPQFSPLNVACAHKNLDAVKLILEIGKIDLTKVRDSQGLCPLHIVAKNAGDAQLIELLVSHGADPNSIDGFNQWTPIFYAIQEGHTSTVEELIKNGARLNLTDDDNLSPIYYALWEGHLSVLNVLLKHAHPYSADVMTSLKMPSSNLLPEDTLSVSDSLHDIPDFALPPPIIPLRKYGHNFLERKIFVKLLFKPGSESILLNKEDEMVLSSPGRITLTSNVSDIIPRNIILPIEDDEDRVVMFQIDSLDNFSIDFEVFPAFGTRIIAKTSAVHLLFQNYLNSSKNDGHIILPLFDSRLKNVGELICDYQLIFPFNGKPLEITKYDTYWKSTSSGEPGKEGDQFVTSSSLSGKYITVVAFALNDGTLVVTPDKVITVGTTKLFLCDLNQSQLESLSGFKLEDVPEINSESELKHLLKVRFMSLKVLLSKIPVNFQLDIEVCFPTKCEIESIPVKLTPQNNINGFVDSVLTATFEHVRDLRHHGLTRSIVFSSCNPRVCSVLNWKQPNYPVLFHMNGIKKLGNNFVKDTPHHLKYLALDQDKISYKDPCSRCIREAVQFSSNNNLLGIVVPYDLLCISKNLIDQIRRNGLLLIGSMFPDENIQEWMEEDINGIKTAADLEFKGSIDM